MNILLHNIIKKRLPPPENWQDFESLCKKLFGEIWGCPLTIKKNGRLGQPQAGVDIYGKPKGESDYWGIQCKGKETYEDKQLTQKEIDIEIQKALSFEPKLKTFIFATSASKDVNIEKYVRLKDVESIKNGHFEILLYCWQDLVDSIQESRETYNSYVNNVNFKDQFDVDILINTGIEDQIIKPTFLRTTTVYEQVDSRLNKLLGLNISTSEAYSFGKSEINRTWCKIKVYINNSGSKVLEDWRFTMTFPETVAGINDDLNPHIFSYPKLITNSATWLNHKDKTILYKPLRISHLGNKP